MSREIRKQLLSMVWTLDDANRLMKKIFLKSTVAEEAVVKLLSDCQDAAVAVGNRIEALQGEGTESVKELEGYCEDLYQMALLAGDVEGRKTLLKTLTARVKKIREFMELELPDRKEIVFLPYKSSMWDSLESVWKAANEDDECDVYVIPIPYFDKNSDGSFGAMHYEGDMYPDYVPVIHYDDYNFETRHPDVIFIHNPYDDCNIVTSVEPYFYSDNLKNFTEKLVYIPYFVLGEIELDDQKRIEKIRHFCVLPGTVNAHKVIVESENIRQIYIQEFLKTAKMQNVNLDRRKLEQKILALGSPKYDKVRSLSRENMVIPKAWEERLNGKKVILYNTTISALLKWNAQYIRKMESVFKIFGEVEDAVLLWRPHPLLESTLLSMRSDLYKEYMRLKAWFIEERIGIYDDTADMYTAIGISDGYYGDWSSLIYLYKQTAKPILIQDVED